MYSTLGCVSAKNIVFQNGHLLSSLKKLQLYCFASAFVFTAQAQFYLRGNVRDEKNFALPNAKICLLSTKQIYSSGNDGSFGITSPKLFDSLRISLDGFETQTLGVKTDLWQNIILKVSSDAGVKQKPKLISVTKDLKQSTRFSFTASDETYFKLVENEFVNATNYPNTGFSLNVNKASYSNVRRFINSGSPVPPDAVRTEELVNYFGLDQQSPAGNDMFDVRSRITRCPWNDKNRLLFLNVNAKKIDLQNIPPGNFVFLIDVSGSMDLPNRLPLLKAAFQLFVKNLRPQDRVSIVIYGGTVGIWLPPTPGSEKEKINQSIELLVAAGDTPGESAILAAYKLAASSFITGGNNRVIIATDGDFNVGQTSEKALDELITKQRMSGVYLTCLGVGMGNLKDSKLVTLAKKGNGNYAYLDDLHEAEKVLVHELTQTLYTVADNALLNISFDPGFIKSYRLIGFDNKKDALAYSDNDLEGGEIGSGSSTTAMFEITPADTLRSGNFAQVKIRYHDHEDTPEKIKYADHDVTGNLSGADAMNACSKFEAAVCLYALMLRDSKYRGKGNWEMVSDLAIEGADSNNYLQQEFLRMLDKTINIYEPKKKKKNKKPSQ